MTRCDRRRIAATEIGCRLDVHQSRNFFKRGTQLWSPRNESVSIRCHKMDKSLRQHPCGHLLARGAEGTSQTAGSHLHQASMVDQGAKQCGLPEQARIPLGM